MKKVEAERLPDMNIPRAGHSMFMLNGELTVFGGHTSGFVPTPTAEYFSNGQWHLLPMVYPHDDGISVAMRSGKVLLAGGHAEPLGIGQTFPTELYDPRTHTFDGFGCLEKKRALAEGAELADGRVVIAGNHQGNDGIEIYDGKASFSFVKKVSVWHFCPYIFPIAQDDAIIFGSVWNTNDYGNGECIPCDTVDRLQGDPFSVPLLKNWLPMPFDHGNRSIQAFIGDEAKGDYSYLVAAFDPNGQLGIIKVTGTDMQLLPTASPIPMVTPWGKIKYESSFIVDRQRQRGYVAGRNEAFNRRFVLCVEYARFIEGKGCPITLYYTDSLAEVSNTPPTLTPEGNLLFAGGLYRNNFNPLSSVWVLRFGEDNTLENTSSLSWIWVALAGLLLSVLCIGAVLLYRRRQTTTHRKESSLSAVTNEKLILQVCQLMEKEKLFLDADLKLNDIARRLSVHRNTISTCVNSQLGCSFSQLTNRYRVEYAQKVLLKNPETKLAMLFSEVGFANEVSFFRAFKAITGLTPREWIIQNVESSK